MACSCVWYVCLFTSSVLKLLKKLSMSAFAYYGACVLLQLNRHSEALELCMVGLGKDNRWPELLWTAGLCCFHLNRLEEAIAWSRLAICAGHVFGLELGKYRWISNNLADGTKVHMTFCDMLTIG